MMDFILNKLKQLKICLTLAWNVAEVYKTRGNDDVTVTVIIWLECLFVFLPEDSHVWPTGDEGRAARERCLSRSLKMASSLDISLKHCMCVYWHLGVWQAELLTHTHTHAARKLGLELNTVGTKKTLRKCKSPVQDFYTSSLSVSVMKNTLKHSYGIVNISRSLFVLWVQDSQNHCRKT